MRCTVHISHLNSVKNHLYYYDTVLVNMEFSFAPKRTKVHERVKISRDCTKFYINFN